jgi:hypothetical protein
MLMSPILMGDYVNINGNFLEDGLLAVHLLLANVGLYTATGTARKFQTLNPAIYNSH